MPSEPERRPAAKLLTKDEARRIASNIGKLPELRKLRTLGTRMAAATFPNWPVGKR